MKLRIYLLLNILVMPSIWAENYEFKDTPFLQAIREVVDNHNAQAKSTGESRIRVFTDTHVDTNKKVSITLKNMPTDKAIAFICQQLGFQFVVKDNYIFILGDLGLLGGPPRDLLPEVNVVQKQ